MLISGADRVSDLDHFTQFSRIGEKHRSSPPSTDFIVFCLLICMMNVSFIDPSAHLSIMPTDRMTARATRKKDRHRGNMRRIGSERTRSYTWIVAFPHALSLTRARRRSIRVNSLNGIGALMRIFIHENKGIRHVHVSGFRILELDLIKSREFRC